MKLEKYMRKRIWLLISLLVLGCIITVTIALVVDYNSESPEVRNAKAFLQGAIDSREQEALSHLSSELKDKVRLDCPNGLVSKCIERTISPSWGKLTGMAAVAIDPGTHSILLHTFWSSMPSNAVPVVIMTIKENNTWVVKGWRGFIVVQSETQDGQLLSGTLHDNEFVSSP
jgi:hypothetical protein